MVPFVTAIPAAYAGVGLGVIPNFPSPEAVGATGVPASLTITNLSNGTEATQTVTMGPVTLTPSCGTLTSNAACTAAAADPGVFLVSATGTGAAGSACAGVTFNVTTINAARGELKFTPTTTVVLGPATPGGAAATCVINFTFNVVKVPTKDASAAQPGVQTEQIVTASGTAADGTPGTGTGTSLVTVADKTAPTCTLTGAIPGPPAQIQVTVQDAVSGLGAGAIVTTVDNNATVSVPTTGPDTTTAVVITATKVNQSLGAQVGFSITDRSGNVTTCDPTEVTVSRTTGQSLNQSVLGLSSAEHFLTVYNSTPGIRALVVTANGHVFVLRLANGQTATLDLAGAFKAGARNSVSFIAAGPAGATAAVVLHD